MPFERDGDPLGIVGGADGDRIVVGWSGHVENGVPGINDAAGEADDLLVERCCALAPAEHTEHGPFRVQSVPGDCVAAEVRIVRGYGLGQRIARQLSSDQPGNCRREGNQGPSGSSRRHTVGETRHRVLLVDHDWITG